MDAQINHSLTDDEIDVATKAVRKYADQSGYGTFISDQQCANLAATVVNAVEDRRDYLAKQKAEAEAKAAAEAEAAAEKPAADGEAAAEQTGEHNGPATSG